MTHLTRQELQQTHCFINGAWMGAGQQLPVHNPATGQLIARVPRCDGTQARTAIEAAHAAGTGWAATPAGQRARLLRRWFELIVAHTEELAQILTEEMGKPLAEARAEIGYGAAYVEWFAEEARRIHGDVIESGRPGSTFVVVKRPVGVVAAITPWNFPCAMLARKLAPALAAGCTVVAKPAEQTPLSALALARLAELAGVPAGVINVVTGDPVAIGAQLCANPLVRKISFTGSTHVGKLLIRQSADTVKRLSMELGGNAPFIVFDDADLDLAVTGAMHSKFRNAGQTCVCANRIYVQAGVYDRFLEKFVARVRALTVGNGLEAVDIGPLIDARAVAKAALHVRDAVDQGARVLVGGGAHALGGNFFAPTVLADVRADMLITREETFGPVAPVIRFESESEVLAQSNDSDFGLAGYFYSADPARVARVAQALECGMVGINTGLISSEVAPFGGIKQSGYGREGSHYGIDDYLSIKSLCHGDLN
ncbi:NAD-dependent succinate-semialdehyde dehydrogenase [Comamonas antarctica]|uniref:NAD-dependent succinate-semialdehyde dehydrogenase n=1 Tax=Comamonas antarctica TaxID=2743470 RepID=A0A6N1WYY6_9BURK|nr:NAD-dependent succinate-semialdehyde dehydrogenase [Comamonas antarctica]QKV52424.1 NAD-dependent succinate-semialdehyde dehydrogenase [Comamonas antarctica]